MRNALIILFVLFTFGIVPAVSQVIPVPAQQQKELTWDTMISTFSSLEDPNKTYVEIALSVIDGQFKYMENKEDGNYYAVIQFDVILRNKEGAEVGKQSWRRAFRFADPADALNVSSLELANFLVAPGTYALDITLTDLYANISTGTQEGTVTTVLRYPTSILSLSDIQLASNIEKVTPDKNYQKAFIKNGVYYVEPYPIRVYSASKPFLFMYAEIYNLGPPKNDNDTYTVEYKIINYRNNEVVYGDLKPPLVKPKTGIAIIAEKINVRALKNDYYVIYVKVTDNATGITAEKQNTFSVYKPEEIIAQAQAPKLQFDITPNNIQEFEHKITYALTSEQRKAFESYDFEAKKNFIIEFWNNQPIDVYKEYMERFEFVQNRFSSMRIEGWRTDRGRVYIMYGPPTEIESHPQDPGVKPWEAWLFNEVKGQSQVLFVFADIAGFGNYELLHSNLLGTDHPEIYDPNWMDRIRK